MGQQQLSLKLFEYLKGDNSKKVKQILLENRSLLNDLISKELELTPIMVCAMFDSVKCFNVLLDLCVNTKLKHPTIGNTILHIAAERDNLKMVKEILGKDVIEKEALNAYEMTALDCAVLKRSYHVSLYLVHEKEMKLKSIEEYKNLMLLLDVTNFQLESYIENIANNIPFSKAPPFLYKVKETISVEDELKTQYLSKQELTALGNHFNLTNINNETQEEKLDSSTSSNNLDQIAN